MTTSTLGRLLSIGAVLGASCAAVAPSRPEDTRCVVAVDPQIRMVTFAPPSGLDEGVISMFFASAPQVKEGDLVRLESSEGGTGPQVKIIEPQAAACSEVVHAIAAHHAQH